MAATMLTASSNPLVKAAACLMEQADDTAPPKDLDWDPLNYAGRDEKDDCVSSVIIPRDLFDLVKPALPPAPQVEQPPSATSAVQQRARRKLQQRREAAAAAAAAALPVESAQEAPIDDSWIDELEPNTGKGKEAKQKSDNKAAQKKKKKSKGGKPAQQPSSSPIEQEEEEEEALPEDAEDQPDDMPAVEIAEDAMPGHGGLDDSRDVVEDQCEGARLEEEPQVNDAHRIMQAEVAAPLPPQESIPAESDQAQEEMPRKSKAAKRKANQRKKSNPQEGNDVVGKEEAHEQLPQEAKQDLAKEDRTSKKGNADKATKEDTRTEVEVQRKSSNVDRNGDIQPDSKAVAGAEDESIKEAQQKIEHKVEGGSKCRNEVKAKSPIEKGASGDVTIEQASEDSKAEQATRPPRKGWGCIADDTGAKNSEEEVKKKWPVLERNPLVKKASVSKPMVADAPEFVPASAMASQAKTVTQTQEPRQKGKKELKRRESEEAADAGSSEDQPRRKQEKQHALVADAPEFVPASAISSTVESPRQKGKREARRKDLDEGRDVGSSEDQQQMPGSLPITTMMITGIPAHHTPDSFREQLDAWGLLGTYDFFFMPSDQDNMGSGYAYVNFIDPVFATLCQWLLQQYQVEGTAAPFQVQGLDGNVAYWNQYGGMDGMASGPLIIQSPSPSEWAVNGVNMMLNSKFSPQIRDQFHKTKMCSFAKKSKCALGSSCPFAHSKDELQAVPDLAKTKLCYNFFRRKCNDSHCKFAHGYQELRATQGVYKTELCRWWSYGTCKAGDACRYAHGVEELRSQNGVAVGASMHFMAPMDDYFGQDAAEVMSRMQSMVQEGAASELSGAAPGAWDRQASGQSCISSVKDGASDMGLSDVSTVLGGMEGKPKRQQTAPPTLKSARFTEVTELRRSAMQRAQMEVGHDTVVLRARSTFIESVQLEELSPMPVMRRSWSDGDLRQLMEVMTVMEEFDEEF